MDPPLLIFCLFDLIQQSFSYIGTGLPGLNQYLKLGLMCLAQGHNTVTPVRFEPAGPFESSTLPLSHCTLCQCILEIPSVKYGLMHELRLTNKQKIT